MSFEFSRYATRLTVGGVVLSAALLQGCSWRAEWQWPEIDVPGITDTARTQEGHVGDSRPESALESKPEVVERHMESMSTGDRR